ncbi:MAG: phosphatidylglycerophosphatase A [Acidobacteria bacterium]|nr:phosphatidylglycerophosphatase A [Acidobacteriota bacterium]
MKTARWAYWLATWGGAGLSPVAPGTVGALAAVAVAWLLVRYAGLPMEALALLALLLFYPGVRASGRIERDLRREDPGFIVVDEVVGQWLALSAARADVWQDWLLALVLFRALDISKPPPVRQLEKLPNGVGVMADDAAAGLCAMMLVVAYRWAVGLS